MNAVAASPTPASIWRVAAVAMLGSLLVQLDATIVNVSLSPLAADLRASLSTIQWVTSGYLLALTFALPLSGWLVERMGAKRLYIGCFAVFTLSSALCALAWSAASLIAFRLLQGASGGVLAPMAQLIMKRAAGSRFSRVAGYAAVPVLLGPLLGPVLAGALLHWGSWRWLFVVNLPVGVLALVLAAWFLPWEPPTRTGRRLDWVGLLLLSPGLSLVLFGLVRLPGPSGFAAAVAGASLLACFVALQRRKGAEALLDLDLFRGRAFRAASIAQFLGNGVMFAGQMLIPLFLIDALGRSPAAMGWMMAPMGLGLLIVMPSMGFLTARLGERRVAVAGASLALVSALGLALLAATGLPMAVLAAILLARGLGLGAVGIPSLSVAYASIAPEALPMATTTLNIVQRIGGPTLTTLCAVGLSALLHGVAAAHAAHAWAGAFALLAALHGLMVMAVAALPRRAEP